MNEYSVRPTMQDVQPTNSVSFYTMIEDAQTEVLRISKECITANPNVPVDEAAQVVLRALETCIKQMTKRHWVGLADEEIADLLESTDYYNFPEDLIINTQTKLRDINT